MPPRKKQVESDPEEDFDDVDEEDEEDYRPAKVARVSTRPPRRAAAAAVSKLTAKIMHGDDDEDPEEEDDDEMPEIPKANLTKYATEINAEDDTIHVIRKGSIAPEMSKALRISDWPVWSSKTGGWPLINHPYEFTHEAKELSLFLEGKCTVTPEGGEPVELGPGDYAVFPKGLVSTWVIAEPVKKRYYEFKK